MPRVLTEDDDLSALLDDDVDEDDVGSVLEESIKLSGPLVPQPAARGPAPAPAASGFAGPKTPKSALTAAMPHVSTGSSTPKAAGPGTPKGSKALPTLPTTPKSSGPKTALPSPPKAAEHPPGKAGGRTHAPIHHADIPRESEAMPPPSMPPPDIPAWSPGAELDGVIHGATSYAGAGDDFTKTQVVKILSGLDKRDSDGEEMPSPPSSDEEGPDRLQTFAGDTPPAKPKTKAAGAGKAAGPVGTVKPVGPVSKAPSKMPEPLHPAKGAPAASSGLKDLAKIAAGDLKGPPKSTVPAASAASKGKGPEPSESKYSAKTVDKAPEKKVASKASAGKALKEAHHIDPRLESVALPPPEDRLQSIAPPPPPDSGPRGYVSIAPPPPPDSRYQSVADDIPPPPPPVESPAPSPGPSPGAGHKVLPRAVSSGRVAAAPAPDPLLAMAKGDLKKSESKPDIKKSDSKPELKEAKSEGRGSGKMIDKKPGDIGAWVPPEARGSGRMVDKKAGDIGTFVPKPRGATGKALDRPLSAQTPLERGTGLTSPVGSGRPGFASPAAITSPTATESKTAVDPTKESWDDLRKKLKDLEKKWDGESKKLQEIVKRTDSATIDPETVSALSRTQSALLEGATRDGADSVFDIPKSRSTLTGKKGEKATRTGSGVGSFLAGGEVRVIEEGRTRTAGTGTGLGTGAPVTLIKDASEKPKKKKTGLSALASLAKRNIKDITNSVRDIAESGVRSLKTTDEDKLKQKRKIREKIAKGMEEDPDRDSTSSRESSTRVGLDRSASTSSTGAKKKPPDAKFEPFKKPENVGKVNPRRLMQWEQMLEGVLDKSWNLEEEAVKKWEPEKPVRKLSDGRRGMIADMLMKKMKGGSSTSAGSEEPIMEETDDEKGAKRRKKPAPQVAVVTRKRVDTVLLDSIEEKISMFKTDGPLLAPPEAVSDEVRAAGRISFTREKKGAAEIEVIIDALLEDAEEITAFSLDEHPFFQSLAMDDPKRPPMTKLFVESLSLNTHLTSISCVNCALDDTFLMTLCGYFETGHLSQLRVLNLSTNFLTDASAVGLAMLLEDPESKEFKPLELTELILGNQLEPFNIETQKRFAWSMRTNTFLQKLDIGTVEDMDARQLIKKGLQRNAELATGSGKTDVIMSALEERIKRIVTNKDSGDDEEFEVDNDFMFTSLPLKTIVGLAKGLRTNTNLLMLRLVNVELSDEFAFAIADSLLDNDTLEVLDLEGNRISEKGILAITESLTVNTTLKHVLLNAQADLIEEGVTAEVGATVVLKLQNNSNLLKFSMDVKDPDIRSALEALISRNCLSQLQMLDV